MRQNPAASGVSRIVYTTIVVVSLAITPLLNEGETTNIKMVNAPLVEQRPSPTPLFQISWQRGNLVLSGHTRSRRHEQDLLRVARSSYSEASIATRYQPLGIVPYYWQDTTVQVLNLLAETASAQAELANAVVTLRGIIVDELAWQSRLDALKTALPMSVSIETNTLLVNPDINVVEVCERAFAAFDSGPINFDESSTDFRSSAYPRLDRVIALAKNCSKSRLAIAGHSDSSGNEPENQRLSLRRANAVGDYVVAGGIDRARLQFIGAGSSTPIADDSTEYGRSLNRRIEIAIITLKEH